MSQLKKNMHGFLAAPQLVSQSVEAPVRACKTIYVASKATTPLTGTGIIQAHTVYMTSISIPDIIIILRVIFKVKQSTAAS